MGNPIQNIFLTIIVFFIFFLDGFAQYPPPPGNEGSIAIHADNAIFNDWANTCSVERGFMDASNESLGLTTYGSNESGIGKADNDAVSLGDNGIATIGFEVPIANGPGWDFAVFENSFSDDFLELAFVEVSSNGIDYYRFNSVSLTQTENQIATFGLVDATEVNNLAGKYKLNYGVPFDLEELKENLLLDIDNIISIRIIDVVGSINPDFATYDSEGNMVNDPWPTPFETSGFDLDAIGVINNQDNTGLEEVSIHNNPVIFPNPAQNTISISHNANIEEISIYSSDGILVSSYKFSDNYSLDISFLEMGFYFISIKADKKFFMEKLIKL